MFELTPSSFFTLPDGRRLRYAINDPVGAPQATIVEVMGRREFIEKKQAEVGDQLSSLNLRQIYVEWYGQGMSDRPLKGQLHQRDHGCPFGQHLDDFRAFFRTVVVPNVTGRLAVQGHSMGGHLLLRWLAEDQPAEVTAGVMTGPMLAIGGPFAGSSGVFMWAAEKLAAKHIKKGEGQYYASAQFDYLNDPLARRFKGNVLTHDEKNFALMEHYFAAHPQLTVGGVTWHWMAAALASIHTSRNHGYLSRINVPVLNIIGSKDIVTPARDTVPLLHTIPAHEIHVIEGGLHDILNETPDMRLGAWSTIKPFLKQNLRLV